MAFNDVFEQFKHLTPAEQQRLIDAARQFVKNTNSFSLRYGAKVQFRVEKTGATLTGTFVRLKQKYAEVMSHQDKFGLRHETAYRWSVPPEKLIPLTAEQVAGLKEEP